MYLLFDIGGTKMRLAVSKDLEKFETPFIFETPVVYEEGAKFLIETAQDLLNGEKLAGVAGGIPGIFDQSKGRLTFSPNLQDWVGKPLKADLTNALKAPVSIMNDANLVGLGEAVFGAGKESKIMAYLTVSTGVGGTRIVDRQIDEATAGFEPGHQIIDIDNKPRELEALISGTALKKLRGVLPKEIPQSDPIWNELAKYTAYGLNNVIDFWSPDTIVLGGSMIVGDPFIPIGQIEVELKKVSIAHSTLPKIKKAELGDHGGLYGALHFLKNNS